MRLVVISHKICWKSEETLSGFVTDGGFPVQMRAISDLFSETRVIIPCASSAAPNGLSPLAGSGMKVVPLSVPRGENLRRKINMVTWLLKNSLIIWREVRRADAVHTPIPGDVGTIGMLFALLLRKPLFVRHCGNWLVQKTTAEHFWKWSMEYFAGGRNVMFATGGNEKNPSAKNSNIKWIFSTSIKRDKLEKGVARDYPKDGRLKLITACRLEEKKGVNVVIESLPLILQQFPEATLDVVGGGSLEQKLKEQADNLGLNGKIKFHGKVKQAHVTEMMKRAHIFCFPTSASEGFPKVVIEALASGLPVITTKVSVLPQLIGNGCGVLLNKPTSENIAEAVQGILSDEGYYHQLSTKAIETAKQYSLENWQDFIRENLRQAWKVSSLSSVQ